MKKSVFDLKKELPSIPALVVDLFGSCNLRCRFCPEGRGLNEQPAKSMDLPFFQHWIGPLLPGLERLELFNWSEPLLYPKLFDLLQWTAGKNPALQLRVSTNGTLIDEETAERIFRSPLQALTITLASTSKEGYRDFHGVDGLQKVLDSLRALASAKKALRASSPKIRLRFLRFPFNFSSEREIRHWLEKHLGHQASLIDKVALREGYLCGTTLSEEEVRKSYRIGKEAPLISIPVYPQCKRALEEPAIRADGAVFPCCAIPYQEENVMGILGEATFEEIWNAPAYVQFRASFREGSNPLCKRCFFRYLKVPLKPDHLFFHRFRAMRKIRNGE